MADDNTNPCPLCGGAEWIPTTDLSSKKCICLQRKFIRDYFIKGGEGHQGHAISTATLTPSPLYIPPKKDEPPVDRTEENLFIKAYWADLIGHLKWALGYKYNLDEKHRFRIVTDERILQIRLGAESYGSRAKSKRDDVETYNSLHDFIGEAFDLVIIRLGFLGHKNIAMAGFLKEALGIREAALKPTWLVESPKYHFGPGHLSYSEELEDYIRENYEIVQIDPTPSSTAASLEQLPGVVVKTSLAASSDDEVAMGSGPVTTISDEPPIPVTEERFKKSSGGGRRAFPWNKKGKKGHSGGAGGGILG